MKKIFLGVWLVFTIVAVYWGITQSIKLSENATMLEKKDQTHKDEIAKLKNIYEADIVNKDQTIRELNERITTLSAPKDIAKTLNELDAQIRDIEERINSINNVGKKLSALKQHLRELKKECGNTAEPKTRSNSIFPVFQNAPPQKNKSSIWDVFLMNND